MEQHEQSTALAPRDWRALVRTYPLPSIAAAAAAGLLISRAISPARNRSRGEEGGAPPRRTIEAVIGAALSQAAVTFLRGKLTEVERRMSGVLEHAGQQAGGGGR